MSVLDHLRSGDTVLVGQGCAEPPELVAELIAASAAVSGLKVICGYSFTEAWLDTDLAALRVQSYLVHGPMRELARRGALEILPLHYSRLEQAIRSGEMSIDVVLAQVSPPDDSGMHSYGLTADHVAYAAEHARAVIVEVNANVPFTASRHRLDQARITESRCTDRPLVSAPSTQPSEAELAIARHTAHLIPDHTTIQLGIGALADAIGRALESHRGLRVCTGITGDWIVGLHESGALDPEHESIIGVAVGSQRLYDHLGLTSNVRFGSVSEQLEAATRGQRLVAVNSAVEVDLIGQVGAEVAGGRYVGGVGGQVDFLRAASSTGGYGVITLPSTTASGRSRIVGRLSGPVTSLKSDVGFIVTEWGVADLRTASIRERFDRIVEVAHPEHRSRLSAERSAWL